MPTINRKEKKKPWQPKREAHGRRKNPNKKFYNSTRWRKTTNAFRKKNPFCKQCQDNGIVTDATGRNGVTDHISGLQYLLDNNIDPCDWDELQTLCNICHNQKSGREAHK